MPPVTGLDANFGAFGKRVRLVPDIVLKSIDERPCL